MSTPAPTGISVPDPPVLSDPPTEKKKAEEREYILFKKIPADSPGGNERLEKIAVVKASNFDQAVRRAAEAPGSSFLNTDGPTTISGVPERSFSTTTVEVETTTRVKLS